MEGEGGPALKRKSLPGRRLAGGCGLCYTVQKGEDTMIVNAQLWGKVLVCYLIAVNVLAFALMGIDKHKARCGAWRISE